MIILDITELAHNPINTGIQRVVRALIHHWPIDTPFSLAMFDPACGLVHLPDEARAILLDLASDAETQAHRLSTLGPYRPFQSDPTDTILVPEVFYDAARCNFYRSLAPAQSAFLVYDLIPFMHPARINVRQTAPLMPYLRLLRDAPNLAFISSQTRADFSRHVRRRSSDPGPVLPLGADGLNLERQVFAPSRQDFLCVGSIDGRKNQPMIITAFQQLWQRGHAARLTLVGRAFANVDLTALDQAAENPFFTWHRDATDDDIRKLLRNTRASLYLSEYEGFGLPPVESLHAGIPVIVADTLPSTRDLPHRGQIRLSDLTPTTIADAVDALRDDRVAAQLWADAATLQLARWADFAQHTANWAMSINDPSVRSHKISD